MYVTINDAQVLLEHVTGRIISAKRFKTPNLSEKKQGPQGQGNTVTEFWLSCDEGDQCFTLNASLSLHPGQSVSLIKAQGKKEAMYVALANHTTGRITHIGSPAAALRWLGLNKASPMGILAYVLCAALCLPIWFFTDGNIVALMGVTLICATGLQFLLGTREKNRQARLQEDYKKQIGTYAEQVATAVSVLGSDEPAAVLHGGESSPGEESSAEEDGEAETA